MSKTYVLGAILVASGLLNSYIKLTIQIRLKLLSYEQTPYAHIWACWSILAYKLVNNLFLNETNVINICYMKGKPKLHIL